MSMKLRHAWLIALAIVALLVAACGPQPATPTPKAAAGASPTASASALPSAVPTAAVEPLDLSTLPVDPDDWRALGPADATVTIVEFSEFM